MQQGPLRSHQSFSHTYSMYRSLDEACTCAHISSSSGGLAPYVLPPLLRPETSQRCPRLPSKVHNQIIPNTLHPTIISTDLFTHWLTPYGIAKLDKAAHTFPIHSIICCRLLIAKCVLPSTLSSYSAGLI